MTDRCVLSDCPGALTPVHEGRIVECSEEHPVTIYELAYEIDTLRREGIEIHGLVQCSINILELWGAYDHAVLGAEKAVRDRNSTLHERLRRAREIDQERRRVLLHKHPYYDAFREDFICIECFMRPMRGDASMQPSLQCPSCMKVFTADAMLQCLRAKRELAAEWSSRFDWKVIERFRKFDNTVGVLQDVIRRPQFVRSAATLLADAIDHERKMMGGRP